MEKGSATRKRFRSTGIKYFIENYCIISDCYQIYLFVTGDFVLTEPILEGKKVKGEIVRILWADQIKEFVSAGVW